MPLTPTAFLLGPASSGGASPGTLQPWGPATCSRCSQLPSCRVCRMPAWMTGILSELHCEVNGYLCLFPCTQGPCSFKYIVGAQQLSVERKTGRKERRRKWEGERLQSACPAPPVYLCSTRSPLHGQGWAKHRLLPSGRRPSGQITAVTSTGKGGKTEPETGCREEGQLTRQVPSLLVHPALSPAARMLGRLGIQGAARAANTTTAASLRAWGPAGRGGGQPPHQAFCLRLRSARAVKVQPIHA